MSMEQLRKSVKKIEEIGIVNHCHFSTWEDFKSKTTSFPNDWIYRGQSSEKWKLASAFERDNFDFVENVEIEMLTEFQRKVRPFLSEWETPNAKLDWLALLQHHGVPTRLLDFSLSPYIAAYFAFASQPQKKVKNISIWAINKTHLNQYAKYQLESSMNVSNMENTRYFCTSDFFEIVFEQHNHDCAMAFESSAPNQRYIQQQAAFVFATNPGKSLMKQLPKGNAPYINKITIPIQERKRALRDLARMNITHSSLFPGVDGLARSIYMDYATAPAIAEIGPSNKHLQKWGLTL